MAKVVYKGRSIVISGDTLIGDYDSDGDAVAAVKAAKLKPGNFMIRIVPETGEEPIQRFAGVYV
jgi:hypothetical protein